MNPFDELNAYGDDELGGFFSSVKKSFSKVAKKVKSVNKKIVKATGTTKIYNAVSKVAKKAGDSDVVKVAAGLAAVYVAGPVALTALKGGVAKLGASGIGKAAVGAVKKLGVSKAVKTVLPKVTQGAVKLATSDTAKNLATTAVKNQLAKKGIDLNALETVPGVSQQISADVNAISNLAQSPEFQQVYAALSAQGYTDDQIMAEWSRSQTMRQTAIPEIAKTIYPQVYQQNLQTGATPTMARDAAMVESFEIAEQEVEKQSKIDPTTIFAVLVPIAASVLLGN